MNGKKACIWLLMLAALLSGCAAQTDDTYTQLENDALPSYSEQQSEPGEGVTDEPTQSQPVDATLSQEEEPMEEPKEQQEPVEEQEPEIVPEEPTHVIEVIDGCTYADGVLIVNKSYTVPREYGNGITADTQAAFDAMQAAAAQEGLTLFICSGFRSYDYQNTLYSNYVARDGQAAADTYSARPGHSEHQTGLALDINSTDGSMATSAEGLWLAEHCAEYGFVIRYPKGKEQITGYMYEPWHIRYLGTELAVELTEAGLTVEEYFGLTSEYAEA